MTIQNVSATNAPIGMMMGATAEPAMAVPPSPAACAGVGLAVGPIPPSPADNSWLLALPARPADMQRAYRIVASDLRNLPRARSWAS
jgi:hypothetical protein